MLFKSLFERYNLNSKDIFNYIFLSFFVIPDFDFK